MRARTVAKLLAGIFLAGLAGAAPRPLAAQEIAVPVAVQIPILVKVLNFDRKLPERTGGRLVVGVLYQSGFRASANIADEVCRQIAELPAGALGALPDHPITCLAIDLDAISLLDSALRQRQVQVLYVSPLRATPLRDVITASRAMRVTTVTGVPRYVESGLAIGVDMKGERPEIVINLAASRAEGADLTSHLLKLARVVGDEAGGR